MRAIADLMITCVAVAASSIALASHATVSAAQDLPNTGQMTALPPVAANRTVRADLLSVLQPVRKISRGNLLRLRGVRLLTHPYGTEFNGLCRRDELDLKYAPVDLAPKPAEQPLQPYGIEAAPAFHVAHLPSRVADRSNTSELIWSETCDRLEHDDDARWFRADTALHAAQGVNFLQAAVDRVKAGTLKAEPCTELFNAKTTCEQVILEQGDMTKINQIEVCPSTPDLVCYSIDLSWSTRLTITGKVAEGQLVPTMIETITVEQYVVVT